MFVEATDPLGHLWVCVGIGGLLLLGCLVEGIHVGLLGGHLLLKRLHIRRGKQRKNLKLTNASRSMLLYFVVN